MSLYFPPTRPVPSAARLEYLRLLREAKVQGQASPSPKKAVPEVPKPESAPSFRKIRARISRKRSKGAKSTRSSSSSSTFHIDKTRESRSTISSDGTNPSVVTSPQSNPDRTDLGSPSRPKRSGDDLNAEFKKLGVREQGVEDSAIIWEDEAPGSPGRADDDQDTSADQRHTEHAKDRDIFRDCADLLTHPFTPNFAIDPSKLNSSSDLLSILETRSASRLHEGQLNILDLGGRISDEYARNIELTANVTVIKAVRGNNGSDINDSSSRYPFGQSPSKMATSTESNGPLSLILEDLSRLPLPSGSIQAISARSLYKDMVAAIPRSQSFRASATGPHWATEAGLRNCLRECHRVLSRRGIIEYIYFDRDVENPGPLITKMEKNFDSFPGSKSGGSQFLSSERFLELLEDAGFAGGKSVVLKFPYMMLSKIFTKDGRRQSSRPDPNSLVDDQSEQELSGGQSKRRKPDPEATRRLFESLEKEATNLNTSWKCVVGWAVKKSRQR